MFKLLKLELKGHQTLGDLKLDFVNEGEEYNSPYSSIIIGPNGTGKSNILRALIDVFRDLYEYKSNGKRPYNINGKFRLEYEIDGNHFLFSNINKINLVSNSKKKIPSLAYIEINGKKENYSFSKLPRKIIANSILLNDKFPFIEEKESSEDQIFPIYKYLGIRSSSSSAGTKTLVKRTVSSIVDAIDRIGFLESLSEILEVLELKKSFKIEYDLRYKSYFYDGNLTIEKFKDFFLNWRKHTNRKSDPWTLRKFEEIRKDNSRVERIVSLINSFSTRLKQPSDGTRLRVISYDIFDVNLVREEFYTLKDLSALDLVKFPKIKLFKRGRDFSLETSSAGEFHFISSLITCFSEAEDNSLILIDEPEISLHPNWQMKYVHLLKELFIKSHGIHFVITTHSHFLISDSKGDTSSVIRLKNIGQEIDARLLPYSTFGWSAEQILLEVFQVPTTRNYFISEKVGEILELISKSDRKENKIREKVQELIEDNITNLSNKDPLKPVINRLIEKYG